MKNQQRKAKRTKEYQTICKNHKDEVEKKTKRTDEKKR
jgi:hypothetical protein